MASGAFNQPFGQGPRSVFQPTRRTHSRSTSISSQQRPSTAGSSNLSSSTFQDALSEQDPSDFNREFDNIKQLLSLVGSTSGPHQLGGYAQHIFPRTFRAQISQRRIYEELETLRGLVHKAVANASRPGSSAGSIIAPEAWANALGEEPTTPNTRAEQTGLEDPEDDVNLLTPVPEQKTDPFATSFKRGNERLLGASEETSEQLAEAKAQVERLDGLLRQNEVETEGLKKKIEDQDDTLRKHDDIVKGLQGQHEQRLDELKLSGQGAQEDSAKALQDLREKHAQDLREADAKLKEHNADRGAILEQHRQQVRERESTFETRLAEKDHSFQLEREQHERALKELEESYEREKEVEVSHWQKEIARYRNKCDVTKAELRSQEELIDQEKHHHGQELAKLRESKDSKLNNITAQLHNLESEHREAAAQFDKERGELTRSRDRQLESSNRVVREFTQRCLDLKSQLQNHKESFEEETRQRGVETARMIKDHEEELSNVRTQSQQLTESSKMEAKGRLRDLEATLASREERQLRLQEEHSLEMQDISERHRLEIADLTKEHQKQLDEQHAEFAAFRTEQEKVSERLRVDHTSEVNDLTVRHRTELENKHNQIQTVQEANEARLQALHASHTRELEDQGRSHQESLQKLQEQIDEKRKEFDLKHSEHSTLSANHDALQKRYEVQNRALAGRSAQLEELRKEHERVVQSLSQEHAHKLKEQSDNHKFDLEQKIDHLNQARDEYEHRLQDFTNAHERDMRERTQTHLNETAQKDEQIAKMCADHSRALDDVRVGHEQELQQQRLNMTTLEEQLSMVRGQNEAGRTGHSRELEEVEGKFQKLLEDTRHEHEDSRQEIEERHNALVAYLQQQRESAMAELTRRKENEDKQEALIMELKQEKELYSKTKQSQDQQFADLAAKHKAEVESAVRNANAQHANLLQAQSAEIAAVRASSEQAIDAAASAHAEAINKAHRQHEETKGQHSLVTKQLDEERQDHLRTREHHEQRIRDLSREQQEKILQTERDTDARITAKHEKRVEELLAQQHELEEKIKQEQILQAQSRSDYEQTLAEHKASHKDILERSTLATDQQIASLKEKHDQETNELRNSSNQAKNELKHAHQEDLQKALDNHNTDIARARADFDRTLEHTTQTHTKAVEELESRHAQEVHQHADKAKQELTSALEAREHRYNEESQTLKTKFEEALSSQRQSHEENVKDLNESHAHQMNDTDRGHARDLDKIRKELDEKLDKERAQAEAGATSQIEELKRLQAEVLHKVHDDFKERFESEQVRHDEEVTKLNDVLQSERNNNAATLSKLESQLKKLQEAIAMASRKHEEEKLQLTEEHAQALGVTHSAHAAALSNLRKKFSENAVIATSGQNSESSHSNTNMQIDAIEQERQAWEQMRVEIEAKHRSSLQKAETIHAQQLASTEQQVTEKLLAEYGQQLRDYEDKLHRTRREVHDAVTAEAKAARNRDISELNRAHRHALSTQNQRIIKAETQLQQHARETASLRDRLSGTVATLNALKTGSSSSYASHLRGIQERLNTALMGKVKLEGEFADQSQGLVDMKLELGATRDAKQDAERIVEQLSQEIAQFRLAVDEANAERDSAESARNASRFEIITLQQQMQALRARPPQISKTRIARSVTQKPQAPPNDDTAFPRRLRHVQRSFSDSKWSSVARQSQDAGYLNGLRDLAGKRNSVPFTQDTIEAFASSPRTPERAGFDLAISPERFENEVRISTNDRSPPPPSAAANRTSIERPGFNKVPATSTAPLTAPRITSPTKVAAGGLADSKYADAGTSNQMSDSKYATPLLHLRKSSAERRAERYGGLAHDPYATRQRRTQRHSSTRDPQQRDARGHMPTQRRVASDAITARPQGSRDGARTQGRMPSLAERWTVALGRPSGSGDRR